MVSSIFFTRHRVTDTNLGGATSMVSLELLNLVISQWNVIKKWSEENVCFVIREKREVGEGGGENEEMSTIYKVE